MGMKIGQEVLEIEYDRENQILVFSDTITGSEVVIDNDDVSIQFLEIFQGWVSDLVQAKIVNDAKIKVESLKTTK